MAKKKNGYIVTSSNYTLKEFHKNAPNGEIYERDFMTTTNLSGWDGGVFPVSADGFKMAYHEPTSGARAHNFGKYLEYVEGENRYENWTLEKGAAKTSSTTEGEIKLKNDDSTLLSYAYYGSCTELIHSTIQNIIKNFPAEAYSTTAENTISGIETIEGCKYILNNPFGIDFMTEKITNRENINELRYFALSYARYDMEVNSLPCGCVSWFSVENNPEFCSILENGTWDKIVKICAKRPDEDNCTTATVIRYFFNGKPYYLTDTANLKLRLSAADIEDYFNSIDDFEKLLLNRNSKPIYSAVLDFPHETRNGIETYKKKFTWPLDDGGWNIDISSVDFANYVNSLLELSEFYDSYRTDNLWRMMTHDSIKNMDLTFTDERADEGQEDYNEGTTRLRGLLWAYGRLFDDLKRYIDNIRGTNTITYDEQGNLPDYFLTDTLGLSGWEVTNALGGLDGNAEWVDDTSREYGISDANVRFMNNLKLNSKSILSRKGTRYGIEMILGLFGFENGTDYSIKEYVSTATVKDGEGIITTHTIADGTHRLSAEVVNDSKVDKETDTPENVSPNPLEGLLTSIFYYDVYRYEEVENAGSETVVELESVPEFAKKSDPQYIEVNTPLDHESRIYKKVKETWKTVIPWIDYSEEIDGGAYFQMFGGWKQINGGNYSETLNYLKVARSISDLTKILESSILTNEQGDYCYVAGEDEESFKNDFEDYYPSSTYDSTWSHYFKLTNPENVGEIGEDSDGWKPIDDSDREYVTYLDSIIDEYRGNNPHVGFGKYDNGEEYFEYIKHIFKGAIETEGFEDEMYECNTGNLLPIVTEQGFEVTDKIEENQKCWYFYDKDRYILENQDLQVLSLAEDGYNYTAENMKYVPGPENVHDVRGKYGAVDTEKLNGEATIFEEPSVINRKNLKITFIINADKDDKFKTDETNYIKNTVMPYLEQMVPSTSILEISFE